MHPPSDAPRRAVFLDRDGVINRAILRDGKPYPPASWEELEILPGVEEALGRLKRAGFTLIVVTNQPDVARGTISRSWVDAVHARLGSLLPIDEFRTCTHDSADQCACRKPKPGMLLDAARLHGLDLPASFMIGDRWRDVEAGQSAGCKTLFVDRGYREQQPLRWDFRVRSLREAADLILQSSASPPPRLAGSTQKPNPHGPGPMTRVENLSIKIFADGADKAGMLDMYRQPFIKGFTTNPTLMRKAGIADYKSFAREILEAIPDRPISFEVFSDDFHDMERQAREISGWGSNVYVKIPITNTKREPSTALVRRLAQLGVKLNITAMMTLAQVRDVLAALNPEIASYVSIFAGRIADTGRDPVPLMAAAVEMLKVNPKAELIWASPRELLNIFQADAIGCHVITVTNDILKKLSLVGYDLEDYSLDTVKMFRGDAVSAGFTL